MLYNPTSRNFRNCFVTPCDRSPIPRHPHASLRSYQPDYLHGWFHQRAFFRPIAAGRPSGLSELSVRVTVEWWKCDASSESRRSPFFGRFDLLFVSDFMLQHPAMADDDIFPISLRFRDLLRQIADTIMTCPEMRADVSTLRVIARSRTTCIDKEIDRLGPRSFYGYLVSSISMEIVGSISFLPIDHPRDDDPPSDRSSLHLLPHRYPRLLTKYNSSGRRTTTSTTTRVGHFVLGGGVRRGHDPRRPENRSLTFFRRRSSSSEGE